ncbi:MAG: hypothetical protein JRF50_15445 [Deltaproteobacteria bacterium]|nr:hypothetical protein [Deltaproteobacteria bacterium]
MKIVMLAEIPACEGGDLCTTSVLARFGFHMKNMVRPLPERLAQDILISFAPFWNGLCSKSSLATPEPLALPRKCQEMG